MTDWTVTVTVTVTPNPSVTITMKMKNVMFYPKLCLKHIFKWKRTCEAIVSVSVKTVTVLSWTIFSCAGDRLVIKLSFYVDS